MSAAKAYTRLLANRSAYEKRAEECCELTIPSLFPKVGFGSGSEITTPYNSVGARGLNHLAAKLTVALLPPNSPWFRLTLGDRANKVLSDNPELKLKVDEGLAVIERRVSKEIEIRALRPSLNYALKLCAATGNVLIHFPEDGGLRVFSLRNFVVERDPSGNIVELVVKECISKAALPDHIAQLVKSLDDMSQVKSKETFDLYTHVERVSNNEYTVRQELDDIIIPESIGTYKKEDLPYLPLRWTAISGESYGRGLVEELLGDLASLEALTKAIVIGSAASARIIGLVNPTGFTSAEDLNNADNGAFVLGMMSDVGFVQVNKVADLSVAMQTVAAITKRIESSFLLVASIQRQAERVTAEEISILAGELEAALGGVYATLSQELQLPMVRLMMKQLMASKDIPKIPNSLKKYVHPTVITGVEALGRMSDLERFRTMATIMSSILGPQALAEEIDRGTFIRMLATNVGVDITGLIKTEEQKAADQQNMQAAMNAQAMVKGATPAATSGIMDMISKSIQQQNMENNQ